MNKLSYKDAKELKDAGFPQGEPNSWSVQFADRPKQEIKGNPFEEYIPTLSELIEACGDDFSHLKKLETSWIAVTHSAFDENGNNFEEFGKTPEQAVKNLWIKLNKK